LTAPPANKPFSDESSIKSPTSKNVSGAMRKDLDWAEAVLKRWNREQHEDAAYEEWYLTPFGERLPDHAYAEYYLERDKERLREWQTREEDREEALRILEGPWPVRVWRWLWFWIKAIVGVVAAWYIFKALVRAALR